MKKFDNLYKKKLLKSEKLFSTRSRTRKRQCVFFHISLKSRRKAIVNKGFAMLTQKILIAKVCIKLH